MIIVTGGAGFIGSNLVAALEARGHQNIVVCDWLGTDEKWQNLAKRNLYDIIFPEKLFAFLNRHAEAIDAIFHMGAISATTEKDADLILRNNLHLTQNLWDWCAQHKKRLIYASSAATYGNGDQGFVDFEDQEALATLRPLNAYGWSKHAFDRRVARIVAGNGPRPTQYAGLKFFNVYGPNEEHKGSMKSVIAHLFPKLKAGEPAKLFKSYREDYPDGGQVRDFIWVEDCVNVMLWLLANPGINGLYNVGTGTARRFDDLAHAVFKALGQEPRITYIDMPESLRPKYQYYTQADLTRLRAAGYDKPFTSLEDGVGCYVKDFLDRDDPYR